MDRGPQDVHRWVLNALRPPCRIPPWKEAKDFRTVCSPLVGCPVKPRMIIRRWRIPQWSLVETLDRRHTILVCHEVARLVGGMTRVLLVLHFVDDDELLCYRCLTGIMQSCRSRSLLARIDHSKGQKRGLVKFGSTT